MCSERWRALPIVVVSASVMKQEQERARAAGCEYFVEKPFDIDYLRSIGEATRLLVCAPLSTLVPVWEDEVDRHHYREKDQECEGVEKQVLVGKTGMRRVVVVAERTIYPAGR